MYLQNQKYAFLVYLTLYFLTQKLRFMNVVVTGASKGIGFQIVQAFAKLGALKIIGVSRNYKQLIQLKEICSQISMTEFVPVSFDFQNILQNESQISGIIKQHLTRIDILINNAGTMVRKPFDIISSEEMDRLMKVNYFAPALLIKNLIPQLKSGLAHVVNITSMGGYQGSVKFSGLSHYSASKAALTCLTECLAEEYKEEGISFNALALGAVQTEMLAEAFPECKAPLTAEEMGEFIANFAINGRRFFNGKVLPVTISTP
jgi:NAD(P)-dependent dehydrogenase (short-subunit alcohol dehydrogenase family)